MKNLIMFVVAMLFTTTALFAAAQSTTPYAKGKYYGKKIIALAFEEDNEGIEKLGTSVEEYIHNNLETEEDFAKFLDGLEAGMREQCKECGATDEEADAIVAFLCASIAEATLQ